MTRSPRHFELAVAALIGIGMVATAAPADVFSYQGRLRESGQPVTGPLNLAFRLYDDELAGVQMGSELMLVGFTDFGDAGEFTVDLDFGAGAFPGTDRWLEMWVDGAPLSPRQPINPTPYAMHAQTAQGVVDGGLPAAYSNQVDFSNAANTFTGGFAGSGAGITNLNASNIASGSLDTAFLPSGGSWSLGSGLDVDSGTFAIDPVNNRVGIGTTTPAGDLHVHGVGSLGSLVVSPDAIDSNSQIVLAEGPGISNGSIIQYDGLNNQIRFRGLSNNLATTHMVIGRDNGNVGIGTTAPSERLAVVGNIVATGTDQRPSIEAIQYETGGGQRGADYYRDFQPVRRGVGEEQNNTTGASNSFFGEEAGLANTGGVSNCFFGEEAGVANTGGSNNAFFGKWSGHANTDGTNNSFFGYLAGDATTSGDRNVFIGNEAGFGNTTGSENTFIGHFTGPLSGTETLTNATAIGARARVTQDNSLVLGSIAGVNGATFSTRVGIGTTAPSEALDVAGAVKASGLLISGLVGIGTTSPAARLSVQGGTSEQAVRFEGPSGNYRFLQQLDGSNLAHWTFRNGSSGVAAVSITTDGRVGMGVNSIDARLHIVGTDARIAKFDRFGSDGEVVAFARDDNIKGNITISGNTVSYNAFTGSHYAWSDDEPETGALMTLTGVNSSLQSDGSGEIVYGVAPSAMPNDPACLGTYVSTTPIGDGDDANDVRLVSAVGNGDMWVVNTGRDIAPGDLLISSDVAGCAMLDEPTRFAVGHIVAREPEPVDWTSVDGDRVRISVLYDVFTCQSDQSTAAQLAALVAQRDAELELMRTRINQIEQTLAHLSAREEAH